LGGGGRALANIIDSKTSVVFTYIIYVYILPC
jgi:hypothetical protein